METDVATVVAVRGGRVLAVRQPDSGVLALPGGKLEPGEEPRMAAARELREETGIAVGPGELLDLGLRIEAAPVALHPFALVAPPRPLAAGELRTSWIERSRLESLALAPGFARSVHAALAAAAIPEPVPDSLLEWFAAERGALPWRATRDPYAVLVFEVMSQRTQIDRVADRWRRWIERWPTAASLAGASLGDVLRAWQGLGYPRRARDLHAAATSIAAQGWPPPDELEQLPGVGRYTADAIRCFALEQPVLPRDANVRRVLARRFPGGIAGERDPWRVAGALMDLGRAHCRATPRCEGCPARRGCLIGVAGRAWDPAPRPPRQAPYAGSLRERRGRLLAAALAGERPRAGGDAEAAASLLADGLVAVRDEALVAPPPIVGGGP